MSPEGDMPTTPTNAGPLELTPEERHSEDLLRFENAERAIEQSAKTVSNQSQATSQGGEQ